MTETGTRKRRLFAGVELNDATREACTAAAQLLQRAGFAAKYEAPEKLHVTLAFLGYVEHERVGAVEDVLRKTARQFAPFAVSLDRIGAFPHERRPRVVFVGARAQGAAFRTLADALRDAYAELGFSFDNDAVAHVTIARVKESKRPLPAVEFAPIELEIDRLALFESRPDPIARTSRYETIATVSLA